MVKNITSFFRQCDRQLNIMHTFWYRPAYLISPYQKTLKDIFSIYNREKTEQMAEEAFSHNGLLSFKDGFEIISPKVDVSLCMIPADDKVFVYGIETFVLDHDYLRPVIEDTVYRFMEVVKKLENNFNEENDSIVRNRFEQIQKLNNDLLNMQRELKKVNTKLNLLNTDLNNRLVKDSLTGLISRYQYRQEIEYTISKDPDKFGIFTFIDLDDFKRINDNYGHRAGDYFLKEFATRLTCLPFNNLLCIRISGDEFGLYIHGYESVDSEDIKKIWHEIKNNVLNRPIKVNSVDNPVLCSAGMSVYKKDTDNILDLIEYADFAMYEAKKSGKNSFREYDCKRYVEKSETMLK